MKGFSIEQLDWLYNNHTPTRKFQQHHFADREAVIIEGEESELEKGGARAEVAPIKDGEQSL